MGCVSLSGLLIFLVWHYSSRLKRLFVIAGESRLSCVCPTACAANAYSVGRVNASVAITTANKGPPRRLPNAGRLECSPRDACVRTRDVAFADLAIPVYFGCICRVPFAVLQRCHVCLKWMHICPEQGGLYLDMSEA